MFKEMQWPLECSSFSKQLKLCQWCPEIIYMEKRQQDGLTHEDLTALHKTVNIRQSVTREVRPRRGSSLTVCLCFYTKHNCFNLGFAFDFKIWHFIQKNTCSSHAGISFHCWLRSRYTSWERQKLVFCDALTAGIRRKGRELSTMMAMLL